MKRTAIPILAIALAWAVGGTPSFAVVPEDGGGSPPETASEAVASEKAPEPAPKPAKADPAEQKERIDKLVKDLGHEDYAVRTAAQEELVEIGPAAIPQVREATRSDDPEVELRSKEILKNLLEQAEAAVGAAVAKNLLWKQSLAKGLSRVPLVHKGLVLFTGADEPLYAAELKTGKILWKSGNKTGACRVEGDTLYAAGKDGKLHALDPRTGEPRDGFEPVSLTGTPAPRGGKLFLFNGQSLQAVDPGTGKPIWSVELPAAGQGAPIVGESHVLAMTARGHIAAFKIEDGSETWRIEEKKWDFPPTNLTWHKGRLIYRYGTDVKAIDAETGEIAWTFTDPKAAGNPMAIKVAALAGNAAAGDGRAAVEVCRLIEAG